MNTIIEQMLKSYNTQTLYDKKNDLFAACVSTVR